jgi:hypothetical protein
MHSQALMPGVMLHPERQLRFTRVTSNLEFNDQSLFALFNYVTLSKNPFSQKEGPIMKQMTSIRLFRALCGRDPDIDCCALATKRRPNSKSNTTTGAHSGVSFDHRG